MRKGRKPTAAERKLLELNNLDTRQWLVITHEPVRMLVRNKSTQEERVLSLD